VRARQAWCPVARAWQRCAERRRVLQALQHAADASDISRFSQSSWPWTCCFRARAGCEGAIVRTRIPHVDHGAERVAETGTIRGVPKLRQAPAKSTAAGSAGGPSSRKRRCSAAKVKSNDGAQVSTPRDQEAVHLLRVHDDGGDARDVLVGLHWPSEIRRCNSKALQAGPLGTRPHAWLGSCCKPRRSA
jgi:hypothetical protein